ncbi:MAG: hypothetical protein QW265_05760 [Candidatus Bathyarchaeia archaeon]
MEEMKYIQPITGPCFDFSDEYEKQYRKTVFIVPIKIKKLEDGSLGISYACSRGEQCHDLHCRYAYANKNKVKALVKLA